MPKALLKRQMAFGDVLMTTPILRRLVNEGYNVYTESMYQDVFEGQPGWAGSSEGVGDFDRVVDLNMSHEQDRAIHPVHAYMKTAFGDNGAAHDLSVTMNFIPIEPKPRTIAIHPNTSWRNRMMPPAWWGQVVEIIKKAGYEVISLGTPRDFQVGNTIDTRGHNLGSAAQAAIIDSCAAFACGPSGLFILAGATRAEVVTFITINRPETCLPYRHGQLGWGYHTLTATVPCIGCSERCQAVTFVGCERGDYQCVSTLRPDEFAELTLVAAKERAKREGWSIP